jgi:hypothetical protein
MPVAGSPPVTSTAMAQPLPESPYPQTASSTASYGASDDGSANLERDPLHGFYPEDIADASSDVNGGRFVSPSRTSGSGGCSSGCCSR